MMVQILFENVEWYHYFVNAMIVIIGRSLDILSTRYVTKELKLETNKLAQKMGWKGMVLIQIPLIIIGSLHFYFAFFIFIWSLFLFANNIEGSWYVREVGEDAYQDELRNHAKKAKTWKIVFSEFSSLLTFTLSGIFIIVFLLIIKDLVIVILIALALICQGLLGTIRSTLYIIRLKKEDQEN